MASRFTLAIAKGDSFCNRVNEKKSLVRNIENNEHTVIIAPRRYGKTSLISEVIRINKYTHVWFDFLKMIEPEDVIEVICKKLSILIGDLISSSNKLKGFVYKLFENFKPEFISNVYGQQVRLTVQSKHITTEDIADLLLSIDQLAIKLNKKIVLVCDEFQQMAEIDKSGIIQAAIRHAAERAENVAYIFSGSSRHMLEILFMNKSKPLYRLCKIMRIRRIAIEHYHQFLTTAALEKWQDVLTEDNMELILLKLTERHPYYVNYLCLELWEKEHLPDREVIINTWNDLYEQVLPYIKEEIKGLGANQKRVITYMAFNDLCKKLDQKVLQKIGNTNYSSVKQAIEYLLAKDIIYLDSEQAYVIHDPLLKKYLQET